MQTIAIDDLNSRKRSSLAGSEQLEMKTVGRGPDTVRNEPVAFNDTIAAGEQKEITFSIPTFDVIVTSRDTGARADSRT